MALAFAFLLLIHSNSFSITLPVDDPFWDKYYPPLGWNCRCTVVQVRKNKYDVSNSQEAIAAGERATAKPKQQIFRFNPGKTKNVFPPKHPYMPKGCGNCTRGLHLAYNANSEQCKACMALTEQERIAMRKEEYKELKKDPNYKDVVFDESTGGLKATHKGHNTQSNNKEKFSFSDNKISSAELEKELQDLLFKAGHSVIFCDESTKGKDGNILPALDMKLDGKVMDIRSITVNRNFYGAAITAKNRQLRKYNNRSDVKEKEYTVCLYFHEDSWFTPEKIEKGIEWAKKQTSNLIVKHIVCVLRTSVGAKVMEYDVK